MKSRTLHRYSLSAFVVVIAVACSQGMTNPPPSAAISIPSLTSTTGSVAAKHQDGADQGIKVLYSFTGYGDGQFPQSSLFDGHGTLYGTTWGGGANTYYGTVYSITRSGTEKVLHSFGTGDDGENPGTGVVRLNGTIYGTAQGGSDNDGIVFSLTQSGKETVLHTFSGYPHDGNYPSGNLIDVNGLLYGTTFSGGAIGQPYGYGTVYTITKSGNEKILHSFGRRHDGAAPKAGLINVNGTLYGTTENGGAHNAGTVFSITPTGEEKVVHSFTQRHDGHYPTAGLTYVNGTLYGTTEDGGAHNDGTVFSMSTTGTEHWVYSFRGYPNDGYQPNGLAYVNGVLYGTTKSGGMGYPYGGGIVFSISAAGAGEKVLYNFGGSKDAYANPTAGLTYVRGRLYGTTTGAGYDHAGMVFKFKP